MLKSLALAILICFPCEARERIHLDLIPDGERRERNRKGIPAATVPYGTYGIEAHGDKYFIYGKDGAAIPINHLAILIKKDGRAKKKVIYFLVCESGQGANPQYLANALRTTVVAPTEKLWPLASGLYVVAKAKKKSADVTRLGKMKKFLPK